MTFCSSFLLPFRFPFAIPTLFTVNILPCDFYFNFMASKCCFSSYDNFIQKTVKFPRQKAHLIFLVVNLFLLAWKASCNLNFLMQWMPELRRFAPNVPIVLVGTKLGKLIHCHFIIYIPVWGLAGRAHKKYFFPLITLQIFAKTEDIWPIILVLTSSLLPKCVHIVTLSCSKDYYDYIKELNFRWRKKS